MANKRIDFLTPKEIVKELDKYVIGQDRAKKSVAIALRTRFRRNNVPPSIIDDIVPKNILLIGPTGVGKTEIARRIAKLSDSPFIKVEASKFTEVGYMGRDVESMVRDIVETAYISERAKETEYVIEKAKQNAEELLLDLLVSPPPRMPKKNGASSEAEAKSSYANTREKFRTMFKEGKLNERFVEMEVRSLNRPPIPVIEIFSQSGMDDIGQDFKDMFSNMFPKQKKLEKVRVPEAYDILVREESERLVDTDKVIRNAIQSVENSGLIFIDEIDKIASREKSYGPDVSREGVQRDLLPIIEGSNVMTKYGVVKTDHILFIAAGAFHVSKPSDLIPELQGRFPIRVEMDSLSKKDFIRILKEPKGALIKQYFELLKTENVVLDFTDDGIERIAEIAEEVNLKTENIGARRLHTILEKVMEGVSFEAPFKTSKKVIIDKAYVDDRLIDIVKDEDLSRYIL
ncbi:MAG: ATP-dependent protease ATPase subunit HslU [Deltaproteobacteria bacterium]|jgi:ATP-dependent HslUV protease ATP-binding subunit HslU|nr:ATP-dependent protease ATPase subunit HslU [Deltaproteobacteria bacterium]MCL5880670.1 ATP-dependent protease ATPase subunit HslU [Deltaproteobacteria bacterium]MDA8305181.1 ATP-dependent protease ATPase subunit HslU [Deltaproteobacteria bacterium]